MPYDDQARQRILAAAMQLWAEKGYDAFTMRELGRRLGISASSLYQHFSSKEAIVQHFYAELNSEVWRRFDVDGPSGDIGADLERFLRIKLGQLRDHRAAMTGLLREAIDPSSALSPLHAGSEGTLAANVDGFAAWTARAGLGPELAHGLWLLHLGVIVYWLHDRSEGAALTERLLARVRDLGKLVPFLGMVPGLSDVLGLLRDLAEARPVAVPPEPDVASVDDRVDVVVIGGGPVGLLTAAFLKQRRPRARVVVLEAEAEPGYKVGESTLSGFCKALRSIGIRQEALRTLFFKKNGLAFSWVGNTPRLADAPEYVLETFDETFQVERRVLDALVMAQVQKLGVQVVQGARVDLAASAFAAGDCVVAATLGRRQLRLGCRWVVDATGPRASLARRLGLWTDDGIAFQTHAVWAAFEGATPLSARPHPPRTRFSRDEYTWHFCMPQGWVWWIPQVSWHDTPMRNLDQAFDALLREGRLPDRDGLAAYGCYPRERLSVGLLVRSDRDDLGAARDPEAAFAAARQRFPVLDEVLDGARLVPDLTPAGPWGQRANLRGHAREVVGDGWLAVGDAAFFVDPLISPGLTGGTATAWQAARALAEALDGTPRTSDFDAYQGFTRRLHQSLELDNQLVYHSFDHPELTSLVQRFQEITARSHFLAGADRYDDDDTNVWGILDADYAEQARALHALLSSRAAEVDARVPIAEQRPEDHADTVRLVRERFGARLDAQVHLTPYVQGARR